MQSTTAITPLYGLVLAGGHSTRMGRDKGEIAYHGTRQRSHLFALLSQCCEQVYISCREEQQGSLGPNEPFILDQYSAEGPLKGILSAHEAHPKVAWLVVAVDLPNVIPETLSRLVQSRDSEKWTTAYVTRLRQHPEPLLAIWEVAALEAAKQEAVSGNFGPVRMLRKWDIREVYPQSDGELLNVNRPEDLGKV